MFHSAGSTEARSTPHRRRAVWTGLAALAAFVMLGLMVRQRGTTTFDAAVRAWTVSNRSSAGVAFFALVSTYGSVTPMIVYSAAAYVIVSLRRRSTHPLTGLVASAVAVLAYLATKSVVLRIRPSGVGNAFEGTYAFPSAHATTSSAVCGALGYVLWRERVVSGAVAMLIATVAPLVIGVSRVYLDVHWSTDVIGGWCLGLAIAALTAALYETIGAAAAEKLVAVSVR